MEGIKANIEEIEALLAQVLNIIESFNDLDFDNQLSNAQEKIEKARLIKTGLQERYKKEEIGPYEENMHFLAKQIEKKFDNIIKGKELEKEGIGQEIEQLKNKKRLQNYRR